MPGGDTPEADGQGRPLACQSLLIALLEEGNTLVPREVGVSRALGLDKSALARSGPANLHVQPVAELGKMRLAGLQALHLFRCL